MGGLRNAALAQFNFFGRQWFMKKLNIYSRKWKVQRPYGKTNASLPLFGIFGELIFLQWKQG